MNIKYASPLNTTESIQQSDGLKQNSSQTLNWKTQNTHRVMLHCGKQAYHEHCSSRSPSSQNAGPATIAALLLQLTALWSYLVFLNICIRMLSRITKHCPHIPGKIFTFITVSTFRIKDSNLRTTKLFCNN